MKTKEQLVQSAKKHAYYQVGVLGGDTLVGVSFSGPWGRVSIIENGSVWTQKKGCVVDATNTDAVQLEKAKASALRILSGEYGILS